MLNKAKNTIIIKNGILAILALAYLSIQIINIEADTPAYFDIKAATYCDEGYKTLDARNLVLFGKYKWSDYDQYHSWIRGSSVTVLINYFCFKAFGVSIGIARSINLIFAIGCIFLFSLILNKIYDRNIALLGTLLACVNQVFFFYSRLAFIEFKAMFFIMVGLYSIMYYRKSFYFLILATVSWILAFLCKSSAIIFFLIFSIYFTLQFNNFAALRWLLKNIHIGVIIIFFLVIVLQYIFMFHREFYDSVSIFTRHFRSPAGAILYWITQLFFTRDPISSFFAILYSGTTIVSIKSGNTFNKADVFFIIWFWIGTIFLAFLTYQPLLYYVYIVFPLVALAVRGIFSVSIIFEKVSQKKDTLIYYLIYVFSSYVLLIHLFYLPFAQTRKDSGWDLISIKKLAILSIAIITALTITYLWLRKKDNLLKRVTRISLIKITAILISTIVIFDLYAICKWAVRPEYKLVSINKALDGLDEGSIIIGDWAPQLCINTKKRVLYTTADSEFKNTLNFYNLKEIKPNYLIITEGINDNLLKKFYEVYPNEITSKPSAEFEYAAKSILLYELKFR